MNFIRPAVLSAAVCCAFLAAAPLSGRAAPVTPADAAASVADGNGISVIGAGDRPALPQASGETKTIDLLIDLQPRTAGLTFNERERSRPSQSEPHLTQVSERRDTVGADAAPPPSGLFGAGATPMVTSKRATPAESDWRPSSSGGGGAVAPGGGGIDTGHAGRSAAAEHDGRWLWVPREVVRFVRENRELVIGAVVGLLALLWVGSMTISGNRH